MTRSGRSGTPRHRIEAVTQPRYDGAMFLRAATTAHAPVRTRKRA
jgi:hypothetical protein